MGNGGNADLSRHTSLGHYGAIRGSEEPDLADPQLWSPVRRGPCTASHDLHDVRWCRVCLSTVYTRSGHLLPTSVWRSCHRLAMEQ